MTESQKTTDSEDWEKALSIGTQNVRKTLSVKLLREVIENVRTAARESALREALEGVEMKYLKKGDKGFGTQLIRDYHKGLDAARTAIERLLDT